MVMLCSIGGSFVITLLLYCAPHTWPYSRVNLLLACGQGTGQHSFEGNHGYSEG